MENLIQMTMERATPGQKFNLRSMDVDTGPIGPVFSCAVVDKLPNDKNCPVVLAHIGETQDVSLLYLTTDEVDEEGAEVAPGKSGNVVLTVIVVCSSDAEMDYKYPAKMLSDEWAGALFVVLD